MLKRLIQSQTSNLHLIRPVYLRSFSSSVKLDLKLAENNETVEQQVETGGITFVQANPLLKQVFERTTKDGWYPRIKSDHEYLIFEEEHTKLEIQDLIKKGHHDQIFKIIDQINEDTDQRSIQILASCIYDLNLDMMKSLDSKLLNSQMSDQIINFYAWSASHFDDVDLLAQIIFRSTILNQALDLQTYIKCTKTMLAHDKMDLLTYTCKLYEVENQCIETQSFGAQVLQELQENNGVYDNIDTREEKPRGKKRQYREDPPNDYDVFTNNEVKKSPNKKPRNPDAIMKAAEILKDQNVKKQKQTRKDQKSEAKKKIENQIFDAYKDPVDGNFYLQIDPEDLEQFSMSELEVLNGQFQRHVEKEKVKKEHKAQQRLETEQEQEQVEPEVIEPDLEMYNLGQKPPTFLDSLPDHDDYKK